MKRFITFIIGILFLYFPANSQTYILDLTNKNTAVLKNGSNTIRPHKDKNKNVFCFSIDDSIVISKIKKNSDNIAIKITINNKQQSYPDPQNIDLLVHPSEFYKIYIGELSWGLKFQKKTAQNTSASNDTTTSNDTTATSNAVASTDTATNTDSVSNQDTTKSSEQNANDNKSSSAAINGWMISTIVLAVLLLSIIGLICFLLKRCQKKDPKAANPENKDDGLLPTPEEKHGLGNETSEEPQETKDDTIPVSTLAEWLGFNRADAQISIQDIKNGIEDIKNRISKNDNLWDGVKQIVNKHKGKTIEDNKIQDVIEEMVADLTKNTTPTPDDSKYKQESFVQIEDYIRGRENLKKIWENTSKKQKESAGRLKVFFYDVDKILKQIDDKSNAAERPWPEILKQNEKSIELKKFIIEKLRNSGIQINTNSYDIDSEFGRIANLLKNVQEPKIIEPKRSEEEIISEVIKNDKLLDKDWKVIVEKVIDKIRNEIPEDKRNDIKAESLEDIADIIVRSAEATRDKDDYAKLFIQEQFIQKLKNLKVENKNQLKDVIKELNGSLDEREEVKTLLEKYHVKQLGDLEKAVKSADHEKISEQLRSKESLSDISDEIQKCDTTEKLINSIVKQYEKAKDALKVKVDNEKLIVSNIKDNYQKISSEPLTAEEPLAASDELCTKAIAKIENQESEIVQKEQTIKEQQGKISVLEEANSQTASQMADNLRSAVMKLAGTGIGGLLISNDTDSEYICNENIESVKQAISLFVDRFQNLQLSKEDPASVYQTIQKSLLDAVAEKDGAINRICRYYAYSMQPFMTDAKREYGVRFNRKLMVELYNTINELASDFGIRLIVPILFTEKISDGEYENVTGQEYGDLDNLCPNPSNYKVNISSADKNDIIVDLVQIGYYLTSEKIQKAKVII